MFFVLNIDDRTCDKQDVVTTDDSVVLFPTDKNNTQRTIYRVEKDISFYTALSLTGHQDKSTTVLDPSFYQKLVEIGYLSYVMDVWNSHITLKVVNA